MGVVDQGREKAVARLRKKQWLWGVGILTLSGLVGFGLSEWRSREATSVGTAVQGAPIGPLTAGSSVPGREGLRAAPGFELPGRQGGALSLRALSGKVVVVHFWASWCAPCLEEIPHFVDAARSFESESRIHFVAITLDKGWAQAERILKSEGLPSNLWYLLDSELKVAEAYGSYQFPETYVLVPASGGGSPVPHGIAKKWVGAQEWAGSGLRNYLRGLLGS